MPKIQKLEEELVVKYDGELSEVDVDTFFKSLIPLTLILQEVQREIDPNTSLKIKIRPPKSGSFEIFLGFEQSLLDALLDWKTITGIGAILGILKTIVEIRKHLKGKQPKSIEKLSSDNVSIENNEGVKIIVDNRTYNISIQNSTINNSINRAFEALNDDSSIKSFEVFEKNKPGERLLVERNQFENVSSLVTEKDKTIQKETHKQTLTIFKLVFEERYKWEFYLKGHKHSMTMEDKEFYNRIDSGEQFSKGDRLEVELETIKEYDESVKDYIVKSYVVKKVPKHIPTPKQSSLSL